MKSSIRHGAVVRCDMVTVVDTPSGIAFTNECETRFTTYSVSKIARTQAELATWARVKVRLVRWPGQPPAKNSKKVDLCPDHAKLVMTEDEYKVIKATELAARKAERTATKIAKPRKPRKSKIERDAERAAKTAAKLQQEDSGG